MDLNQAFLIPYLPEHISPAELRQIRTLMPYQRRPDRVGRGSDHWRTVTGKKDASTWDYWLWHLEMQGLTGLLPFLGMEPIGPPLAAYVAQNRWIVVCECGDAWAVDPDQPYVYCFGCVNFYTGGAPRRVHFPEDWPAIERVLLLRPFPFNRNWTPGETLDTLRQENVEHGLPVQPPHPRVAADTGR